MHRHTAEYVSHILSGAPPGEMPVSHIDRMAISINMKTAKTLCEVIAPSLLAEVNEVIE
jgi:ABC-type uncharacterized transport system substrate-binding protein